jgi:putative nucleotidyltransferase with HDIG domain
MHTLLEALALHDRCTAAHCRHVADLALDFANHLRLPSTEVSLIGCGALLHDLGKLGVPAHVLNKPGTLTKAEWRLIRRHPDWGARLLQNWPQFDDVATIIHAHHERWDGTGYPYGLRAEAIPLGARIVSLVDAFIAMTEPRSYTRLRTLAEALIELEHNVGTQFDPDLTASFCAFRSADPAQKSLIAHLTRSTYDYADYAAD